MGNISVTGNVSKAMEKIVMHARTTKHVYWVVSFDVEEVDTVGIQCSGDVDALVEFLSSEPDITVEQY
jgi:hypothetical protein